MKRVLFLLGLYLNMCWLVLGLMLFFSVHLLPSIAPGVRDSLILSLGKQRYKGLFGLVSVIGLALIIFGLKHADYFNLYRPPEWSRHMAMSLMMPAIYLFLSNQALPTRSFIKRLTPNPLNWSIVVWSAAHLMANGVLAQVLVFMSFGLFAVISILSSHSRQLKPPRIKVTPMDDVKFVGLCVIVYLGLFLSHGYFTGVFLISW